METGGSFQKEVTTMQKDLIKGSSLGVASSTHRALTIFLEKKGSLLESYTTHDELVAAFTGFAAQAELARSVSAGASALHTPSPF